MKRMAVGALDGQPPTPDPDVAAYGPREGLASRVATSHDTLSPHTVNSHLSPPLCLSCLARTRNTLEENTFACAPTVAMLRVCDCCAVTGLPELDKCGQITGPRAARAHTKSTNWTSPAIYLRAGMDRTCICCDLSCINPKVLVQGMHDQ